jgi:hypothetical protein
MLYHVTADLAITATGETTTPILAGTGPAKKRVKRVLASCTAAAPAKGDDIVVYLDTEKIATVSCHHVWGRSAANDELLGPNIVTLDALVEVNEVFRVGVNSDGGVQDYVFTVEYEEIT